MQHQLEDTIVAPITGQGPAAVAVIRVSGPQALAYADCVLSKQVSKAEGYSLHYAHFLDQGAILDEVVVALFKAPKSFTGEDVVEISFHASQYILSRALELFLEEGARMAEPGEFSMRAYLNGQLDLSQAEAIADLISSSSKAAHDLAMYQLKGDYSNMIKDLRDQLIRFAALLELELDFAEEDVEFADRTQFVELIDKILTTCKELCSSFQAGNAIKSGIPVAIVGAPNAGKSTLLNALLRENRAIVSDIAGTTRDTIEDEMTLAGHSFRFIDTAGIRETDDQIEQLGIARSFESVAKASLVLWVHDSVDPLSKEAFTTVSKQMQDQMPEGSRLLMIANKSDIGESQNLNYLKESISISAKAKQGLAELETELDEFARSLNQEGKEMLVSNMRHFQAFQDCIVSLEKARQGLTSGLSTDLVAFDLKEGLAALGSITGEITNDDLLGTIFSEFCIGK